MGRLKTLRKVNLEAGGGIEMGSQATDVQQNFCEPIYFHPHFYPLPSVCAKLATHFEFATKQPSCQTLEWLGVNKLVSSNLLQALSPKLKIPPNMQSHQTPEMIESELNRWLDDLRHTGFPGTDQLDLQIRIQKSSDFGAWLHADDRVIEITDGSLKRLDALIGQVVGNTSFTLPSQMFPDETAETTRKACHEIIASLASQWLVAHELSHWLLGHPEFLFRNFPASMKALGFSEMSLSSSGVASSFIDSEENICAELQADDQALELLDYLYTDFQPFDSNPFNDYPKLCTEENSFFRLRIVAVAAGIVMLLLDTLRSSQDYPSPATRVFNLLKIIFAVSNKDSIQFSDSGPVMVGSDEKTLETLRRSLHETILATGLDLTVVSQILKIETTLIEFKESSSPTLSDLLRTSGIGDGDFETEAAKLYSKWEEVLYSKMREAWLPFSRVEVWTPPKSE